MKFKLYIIFLLSTFILASCRNDVSLKKEGLIHYELVYLDGENSSPIITFLPNDMTYAFKPGKTVQKVEGWGGVFKMTGISDSKTDSVTALIKILGEKKKYKCRIGEDNFGYTPLKGLKYEYLSDEKEIAGYNCKKVIAHHENVSYELYYTTDIDIQDPNWNTPFKEIDGILMEYQISMFGIKTKITAKEVEFKEIKDSDFSISDDYQSVDKKEIKETVYKYIE